MSNLGLQDVFEPYYEGRESGFATIDPKVVEKARKVTENIESGRKPKSPPSDGISDKAA